MHDDVIYVLRCYQRVFNNHLKFSLVQRFYVVPFITVNMSSLNQTQTAIFTLLSHILLPGDHVAGVKCLCGDRKKSPRTSNLNLNQTQTAIFTHLLDLWLPGDHFTRMY